MRPPADAYQDAETLLQQMKEKRASIRSFRIAGSIDHVQKQRVRGKAFIFARLPHHLRIDILSPFGNTLSVLTADEKRFGLSDYKVGRFFSGAPSPCNVARFAGIPLPPEDMIAILIGQVPLMDGSREITWDPEGHYVVTIEKGTTRQILHIGADKATLPLLRAQMMEEGALVFDVSFDMWRMVDDVSVPFEIRVKMPRDKAELFVQYDDDSVELNVKLPEDAWEQTVPAGATLEPLNCD
jgi:outer membrane lipoprotein-sorting protein